MSVSVGGETALVADAGRTVRYWAGARSGFLYVSMVTMLMALAFGIWLTWSSADAWANGTWAPSTRFFMYTGLVWGLVFVVMGTMFLVPFLRPRVTLRAGTLRIPRGIFHTTRIAAGGVTGIGLAFRLVRSPRGLAAGWYLTVWQGAGAGEQTGISYVPMLGRFRGPAAAKKLLAAAPGGDPGAARRGFSLDGFDPAAQTDEARLASTYPGRVARDLYQRVLSLQGPNGLLAATEQQKHGHVSGRWALAKVLAVWSPDGVMSRPGQ
jgi:hypothetical protein